MNSTVHFDQLKQLIAECSLEEKVQLVQQLERETFSGRLEHFLRQVQTEGLTLDEITAEVEWVRQQHYEAK